MRIEDISKQNLVDANDLELKQLKYKFAKFWDRHFKNNDREIVGCFNRSDFIAKYRLLLTEMDSANRGLQHSTCDIDRQAFKQKMQVKTDGFDIRQLSKIVMKGNYVSLDADFATQNIIKVIVNSDSTEPIELLEREVSEILKDQFNKPLEFQYQHTFEGDCIPLFHEVLTPSARFEKINLKSDSEEIEKDIELVPIEKGDEQIVYGIVYEPDTVDAQGDQANAEEIQKAAYNFMENVQAFKVMHKGKKVKIKILENYIAPVDFKIGKREVKKGSWVLVTRVLDKAVWKDIKAGKLTGYSMAGYARVA